MDGVEESGKTVDEAIEKALEKLGLDETEVEVEVLSMGRSGILGIGGDRARVLVRPKGGAAAPAPGAAAPDGPLRPRRGPPLLHRGPLPRQRRTWRPPSASWSASSN